MKQKIILCALFLLGCTTGERSDWDSGARAQRDIQQERMEDISENVNNQFPTISPGTERSQPF